MWSGNEPARTLGQEPDPRQKLWGTWLSLTLIAAGLVALGSYPNRWGSSLLLPQGVKAVAPVAGRTGGWSQACQGLSYSGK